MSAVIMEWESRLGRRLRVRDLYILSIAVRLGSMAKAARQLAISQPAVSEAIANLEHILGVALLDRTPRGVEPTVYADAILRRSSAVFDELKQGVRDIAFLTDPTAGELKIGCPESISSSVLPAIIAHFQARHPAVVLDVDTGTTAELVARLNDRSLDIMLARTVGGFAADRFADTLNAEVLFHDSMVVVAGAQSRWARRRRIDIGELADARWILAKGDTWNFSVVDEAFRERGLGLPKISMRTLSVHVRANLLTAGDFITVLPKSVMALYAKRFALKTLPIALPVRPWPVAIVTLKNRTLGPLAERFIASAREAVKTSRRPLRSSRRTS
jgi:DNA-binding transcriptional LysR family regulator